jgi:hypothetical protein
MLALRSRPDLPGADGAQPAEAELMSEKAPQATFSY